MALENMIFVPGWGNDKAVQKIRPPIGRGIESDSYKITEWGEGH